MAIRVVDVEGVLASREPNALTLVLPHALDPAREPYRAILLQPEGAVEATHDRVGHADVRLGQAICRGFLSSAVENNADLAIAPEYCVPWAVVADILDGTRRPARGGLWVLGCESITPADLEALAQRANGLENLFFYHEPFDPRQVAHKRYVDPLLYVFWSQDNDGVPVLCMLVQLKTVACRDYLDVEQTSLCVGRDIYAFNRGLGKIGLLSIICSDAFDFTPQVAAYHVNCLLIHIQLNPKPAHDAYAAYRVELCAVGSASHVELICLNWAKDIRELTEPGRYVNWKNVAGSAWYVPPAKFNADDAIVDELHRRGLYYSLLKRRWHCFFLNYEGQILLLQKQKVMFPGDQALAAKTCLSVVERWRWSEMESRWDAGALASDGFAAALSTYPIVADSLQRACQASPLAVERSLELLVGPKGKPTSWYTVAELDAVHLDLDQESIRRVTVHQEVDPTRPGVVFRKQRLQRATDAVDLPGRNVPWPAPLGDLEHGYRLEWQSANPHHNVVPHAEPHRSAALVYLADEADDFAIERIHQKVSEGLLQHALGAAISKGKGAAELAEEAIRSLDRICIVYRRGDRYRTRGSEGRNLIDKPAETSAVDLAGDHP